MSIVNAGTINGDVNLDGGYTYSSASDSFENRDGTVNGNLRFGGGDDTFVMDLGGSTGVTGSIDGGGGFDVMRYRVRGDSSAVLAQPATFEGVAYDLFDGAALTLTAASPQTLALSIAGTGSADITADLTQAGRSVITLPPSSFIPGQGYVSNVLDIVSRGTLTMTAGQLNGYTSVYAVDAGAAQFENAGTINITGAPAYFYYSSAAINSYQGEIVNSGTISLNQATGVTGAQKLINSGSIVQVEGGGTSKGVVNVVGIENSGTISVGDLAVSSQLYTTVLNSGLIESTGGTAISLSNSGSLSNLAGGVIRGSGSAVEIAGWATVINQGAIEGNVGIGGTGFYSYSGPSTFISDGGTVTGNVSFGITNDLFLERGETSGVTGTVDGGEGIDTYGRSFSSNATFSLGDSLAPGFEQELIEARGADTTVTLTAGPDGSEQDLFLVGDGGIVNRADRTGTVHLTTLRRFDTSLEATPFGSFTNEAAIRQVEGAARTFVNSGTIGAADLSDEAVHLNAQEGGALSFTNSGTILNDDIADPAVSLWRNDQPFTDVSIANTGTITGGVRANINSVPNVPARLAVTNGGTITSGAQFGTTVDLMVDAVRNSLDPAQNLASSAAALTNSGRIAASGAGGSAVRISAFAPAYADSMPATSISVVNSGTIEATGAGAIRSIQFSPSGPAYEYLYRSTALDIYGEAGTSTSISNQAGGTISATSDLSTAILVSGTTLVLDNAGTITGNGGSSREATETFPAFSFAGAIQGSLTGDDRIMNSGTITGSINLLGGNDTIENKGTINGNVFLGDGDDSFIQHASATLIGTVDGGSGLDSLIVDATGGGAVNGDQFVNFETFAQRGSGNVTYTGNFNYDSIGLAGGTITVAAGTTLRSNSATAIVGSDGDESVVNYGTIAGQVVLGGGSDSYTEGPGSTVVTVDGGAGIDSYIVALDGDRQGIGSRTGFERLAVTGRGTLSLALDQAFENVSLTGTGIDLRLGGFTVGGIDGSDGAEQVALDGDVARISLGGGDDRLALAPTTLSGSYDGGAGNDVLTFTGAGGITLAGTAAGFENIVLPGGALTVTGTLDATGGTSFGDGAQALTVATGGRLLGAVDLGGGADSFHLASGGLLLGSISGGEGVDAATLELTADMTISGDALRDFETLTATGGGTLTFDGGTGKFGRIDTDGSLNVTAAGSLQADQVQFGGGDDRFAIAGRFAGSVDGGAGTNALALSGGTTDAPIAFQNVSGFESLGMSGGLATIAGSARMDRIDMSGGRLIGLAGSTIAARQVTVGSGATFGSAGTVIGNIAVAGTLSPGASPGTMTVTGNVALASGSTTLLEMTPSVSDRLNVSGTLSIASGATLTLTGERPPTPGAALDLIVADGGITGSFTTVNKPQTVFGFLRQSADRIQLFGQFGNVGFNPQVTSTINYVNAVLAGGQASTALVAAVPSLLAAGNATNGAAFARLNPEAYASATQISVQNGLTLAKAARTGTGLAGTQDAGTFTFVQGLGDWRSLDGSSAQGTSQAKLHSYGLLGGVGYGSQEASLSGFVGYLDARQRIAGLGARTDSDGLVAGLVGHVGLSGFDLSALLAYDGGKADTRRALPGNATAASRYNLRGWISDASISYKLPLGTDWALRPEAGLTYISTRRGSASESGAGAFALDIERRRSHATFIDGALNLGGGMADGATIHPWVSAGVRHQLNGRATLANAGFSGLSDSFSVLGVSRQATLATAGAGVSVELSRGIDLFGAYRGEFGKDGTGTNLNGGVRLRF